MAMTGWSSFAAKQGDVGIVVMNAQPLFPKFNLASPQVRRFIVLASNDGFSLRTRWATWVAVTYLTVAVTVYGCASPPGLVQNAPVDPTEVARSTERFRQYATDMRSVDGVISVYLTSNNNPRQMVVTVDRDAVAESLRAKYGREVDGIRIRYETIAADPEERAVDRTRRIIPSTWWGRLLDYAQNWRQYVFPAENPKPGTGS